MPKPRNEAGLSNHTAHLWPPAAPAPTPFAGTVNQTDHIAPDLRPLAFPVVDLRPAPDNGRTHGERDLASIAASLRAHGQCEPIVAKRTYRDLSNVVLAGNGRLQAARLLKWSHIAVSWFAGTDDEAREFAIRANRTAELSEWNPDALAALQADGVDLLSLGWTGAELGDLLALADTDAVPHFAPEPPVGRLDRLEKHCATCRCREAK